jgi:hypothetical protein
MYGVKRHAVMLHRMKTYYLIQAGGSFNLYQSEVYFDIGNKYQTSLLKIRKTECVFSVYL